MDHKQKFILIITVLLIFLNSCTATRLTFQKRNEIEKNPHGYIIFSFDDKDTITKKESKKEFGVRKNALWFLRIEINNELYFHGGFGSNQNYKIPVPSGKIIIKYRLGAEGNYFHYTTFNDKILDLTINNNDIFRFNIVTIGNEKLGVGCIGQGTQLLLPVPEHQQEVAFEVEKIEPGNANIKSGKK